MTLLLVMWAATVYDCPFGLSKAAALRPLVCASRIEKRWKLTSYQAEANRLVEQAHAEGDSDPLVIVLTGARGREAAVLWKPEIK